MNARIIGLSAALALGGVAWAAGETGSSSQATQKSSTYGQKSSASAQKKGTGGAGEAGYSGAAGSKQLTGRIVDLDSHTLYVEHMGAVIPFRVTSDTRLEGVKGRNLKDEFKPGEEIRTSYDIQNNKDNVALSVERAAKTKHKGKGPSSPKNISGTEAQQPNPAY